MFACCRRCWSFDYFMIQDKHVMRGDGDSCCSVAPLLLRCSDFFFFFSRPSLLRMFFSSLSEQSSVIPAELAVADSTSKQQAGSNKKYRSCSVPLVFSYFPSFVCRRLLGERCDNTKYNSKRSPCPSFYPEVMAGVYCSSILLQSSAILSSTFLF